MKNQQAPLPRDLSDGGVILLHSMFSTIQGEGPYAGQRAIFIRLAGCNLQCPLCDTEYTDGARQVPAKDIAAEALTTGAKLAVITGGEPFRQNIFHLCEQLALFGLQVQIETNGKLEPQYKSMLVKLVESGDVQIVVAPKTHRLDATIAAWACAFKYVVQAGDIAEDMLPISALDHPLPKGKVIARPPESFSGPVYVQPADEQDPEANDRNARAAVEAILLSDDPRRRLCLQMHKYVGLD